MIYFDTSYIVKCYITESGSEKVRRLTQSGKAVSSCELARAEFFAAVHRHYREKDIDSQYVAELFKQLRADDRAGYWSWLPINSEVVDTCAEIYETLPSTVFLRTADAIHLACAKINGFKTVYSHDAHLMKAASFFGLKAIDVVGKSGR